MCQRNSKPIYYCHAYREHLQDYPIAHQRNQLETFLKQWESAQEHSNPSEVNEIHISLDMNLDSLKGRWLQNDYSLLSLAKLVQNYCDMGNLAQMVDEPTRFMFNSVSKSVEVSCLDHVYTNSKYKCSKPTIVPFGNSDHDLVTYTMYSKQKNPTIRGRTYK